MADSPITEDVGVISYEITSDGTKLADTYELKSIRVQKNINRIPTATVILLDGNPAEQDFPVSDSSDLIPGKEVEIKIGYDAKNTSVFKGIVIKHEVIIDQHSGPQLKLEIKDKALKMTVARKNTYFKEKKDSDVMSALISGAGLTADVEATTIEHPMLVQHYSTDWDFMLNRADINGKVVITDAGKVSIAKPDVSSGAVLTVTYGTDLMSFNAELNSQSQLSASTSTAWDMATQKIVQNTGSNPSVNSQGNITSSTLTDVLGVDDFGLQSTGAIDADSLKTWSDAQLMKSWMNRITGTASFQGSALAVPGSIIEFVGVGNRFNGDAYISGVEQDFSEGEWITRVTIGLNDDWYSEKPNIQAVDTSGLLPGVNGLMIGKVKQLDEDPDNEFRILVTIPMMQDDTNGIWARLSNFYATSGAGTFFIPEIDDEVVIGFLNNDPRYPIILGSLYSSKIKPGKDVDGTEYALTSDNYTKAFLTKGQNKMEFNDEDKIITVTTPGKNKIVFDDKDKSITVLDQSENKIYMNTDGILIQDKNSNKIVMDSSGIEINSPKDIKLVATQNITSTATQNVELTATQNVSISGLEVSAAANTAFKASGNATAELSASGQTTVKGAMVMIN